MRIGPKMLHVAAYVKQNPGCTKFEAGKAAWDSWKQANMGYIYGPVNRAIKAGLVKPCAGKGNAYALYPINEEDQR